MFDSTMSWFNLIYIFGESPDTNTSMFIPESSVERSVVPDSYEWRRNDDHAEEVIVPIDDHGYGCSGYEAGYGVSYGQEEYDNNFFVNGSSGEQQALVSLLMRKSHWLKSNPLTIKFRTKLIRYE
ncbi:hypothetical protein Hanom_Chr03g00202691 [Helianthus anomalus]